MAKKVLKSKKAKVKNKVSKFRRYPLNRMNLGMPVFGFIFMYIIIMVILASRKTTIAGYEVKLGSLAKNTTARGVCIREEMVVKSGNNGYVNYYSHENQRVSSGALVYSIDESGTLSEILRSKHIEQTDFSDSDLQQIKKEMEDYSKTFKDSIFSSVYDFKYSVEGTISRITNENLLATLNSLSGNYVMDNSLSMGYAPESGIVIFNTDGLEDLTPQSVCEETFMEDKHQRNAHVDNSLVSEGEDIYKLSTNEKWSVALKWDESWEEDQFSDGDYVNVRFLKNGNTSWGQESILNNAEGKYLLLTFTNSMITFAGDRYIDVELLTNNRTGLKIPNSSIVNRQFYTIPEDYLTRGGSSDSEGFIREAYMEDGTKSTEFVDAKVYDKEENMVYIDTSVFNPGDVLIKPDSNDTYSVSSKASLTGVYNMNNGFADFTKINVLFSNKEYSIVESGTTYGLRVYDHIVLDGESVKDDDFVFDTNL
ncbi:MAG: hypothetical protein IJP84_11065 [Lachnospiraceae bacterium]|nr:hypothetical protein [Lachnospiraceae bacterium]